MSKTTIKKANGSEIAIVSGKNDRGKFYEAQVTPHCSILAQENATYDGHLARLRWQVWMHDPTRPDMTPDDPLLLKSVPTRRKALAALRAELSKRYPGRCIGSIQQCKCSKCRPPKA